jgi:hypothetical protein
MKYKARTEAFLWHRNFGFGIPAMVTKNKSGVYVALWVNIFQSLIHSPFPLPFYSTAIRKRSASVNTDRTGLGGNVDLLCVLPFLHVHISFIFTRLHCLFTYPCRVSLHFSVLYRVPPILFLFPSPLKHCLLGLQSSHFQVVPGPLSKVKTEDAA